MKLYAVLLVLMAVPRLSYATPVTLELDPESPGYVLGQQIERVADAFTVDGQPWFKIPDPNSLTDQAWQYKLEALRIKTTRMIENGRFTFNPDWIFEQAVYPGFTRWFDPERKFTRDTLFKVFLISEFIRLKGFTAAALPQTLEKRKISFDLMVIAMGYYHWKNFNDLGSVANSPLYLLIQEILPLIPFTKDNGLYLSKLLEALPNNAYRLIAMLEYKKAHVIRKFFMKSVSEPTEQGVGDLNSFLEAKMSGYKFRSSWVSEIEKIDFDTDLGLTYWGIDFGLRPTIYKGFIFNLNVLEQRLFNDQSFGSQPDYYYQSCAMALLGRMRDRLENVLGSFDFRWRWHSRSRIQMRQMGILDPRDEL